MENKFNLKAFTEENDVVETLEQMYFLQDYNDEIDRITSEEEAKELLQELENGDIYYYFQMSGGEVAQQLIEECYLSHSLPSFITNYIDYEKIFENELSYNGYTECWNGVIEDRR